MSEKRIVDVVSATTDLIYTIEAFTSVEEFEVAYKLAQIAKEIVNRCGVSPNAVESMDNIINNLNRKIKDTPEIRTLN